MSKRKTFFGILLIILSISTLFLSIFPSIYSNNKAGKIYKDIDTNFSFLKNETKEYALLYFGYVGCGNICPVALQEISQIYKKLDKNKFSFYFINLLPNIQKESVVPFAKAFNKDFKGVYLTNSEIRNIIGKLNIKYLPSMVDKYEIDHSGFLYILKKNAVSYTQKFIYTTRPFDIKYIINDLNNL